MVAVKVVAGAYSAIDGMALHELISDAEVGDFLCRSAIVEAIVRMPCVGLGGFVAEVGVQYGTLLLGDVPE